MLCWLNLGTHWAVTRKTGKHLMTGKRRKTPENTKILQENTKKSTFIVLWYSRKRRDVTTWRVAKRRYQGVENKPLICIAV